MKQVNLFLLIFSINILALGAQEQDLEQEEINAIIDKCDELIVLNKLAEARLLLNQSLLVYPNNSELLARLETLSRLEALEANEGRKLAAPRPRSDVDDIGSQEAEEAQEEEALLWRPLLEIVFDIGPELYYLNREYAELVDNLKFSFDLFPFKNNNYGFQVAYTGNIIGSFTEASLVYHSFIAIFKLRIFLLESNKRGSLILDSFIGIGAHSFWQKNVESSMTWQAQLRIGLAILDNPFYHLLNIKPLANIYMGASIYLNINPIDINSSNSLKTSNLSFSLGYRFGSLLLALKYQLMLTNIIVNSNSVLVDTHKFSLVFDILKFKKD